METCKNTHGNACARGALVLRGVPGGDAVALYSEELNNRRPGRACRERWAAAWDVCQ